VGHAAPMVRREKLAPALSPGLSAYDGGPLFAGAVCQRGKGIAPAGRVEQDIPESGATKKNAGESLPAHGNTKRKRPPTEAAYSL
jgi:hypothetical protein